VVGGEAYRIARGELSWGERALVLLGAAAAYATWFVVSPVVRAAVRSAAHRLRHEGPWLVVEHALLYTTVPALACAVVWWWFARRGWLPPMRESLRDPWSRRTWLYGIVATAAVVAIALFSVPLWGGAIAWKAPNGRSIVGNLFSNFYEEFIYRGFWFAALVAVSGRTWVGVVLSSVIFGWRDAAHRNPAHATPAFWRVTYDPTRRTSATTTGTSRIASRTRRSPADVLVMA